ncbi:glycosyltransferase family 4 protein [Acidovorax sp.]|uniref:glycosyltransferase family 4 protein n=1 Tax=Acidovorax sp. TaxID=1872122 RepID=UPI003BB20F84
MTSHKHSMPTQIPKIGVDFHVIDGKFQGSRSHLLGIYAELVAMCPHYQFYFFLDQTQALAAMPAFQGNNVSIVHMPHANPLARLGWHLPRQRRQYRLDILHTQYVLPFWSSRGCAVTIHDVLFEPFPEFFQPLFVLRSRLMMRWAARHADMLFTVSEYSRQEIASRYGVPAHSIGVLHNAVDTTHFYPGSFGQEFVTQRGLVSGNYLLTVGRIEPRKNHAAILRAYARLEGKPPPLVIVGQRDFGYSDFEAALAAMPATHRVHLLSDVGDQELPALYRHALAFVYPSFAEGFGMPPLEGLASGVPVITSSTTAIPEVVGAAGLLVDPTSESGLTEALQRVCADSGLRAQLIQQGLERAHHFTWRNSAETLAQAFANYLARGK